METQGDIAMTKTAHAATVRDSPAADDSTNATRFNIRPHCRPLAALTARERRAMRRPAG